MPYKIRIAPAAERDIRKLNKQAQKRILDRIEALGAAPRARGVEKLKGKGLPSSTAPEWAITESSMKSRMIC